MRYGSVCSGIEAASVAWHSLGWTPAWLAEVDVSASAVLAHRLGATAPRYPLAGTEKSLKRIKWGDRLVNWGDMTRLPEAVRSGAAEAPDILCGGTPCFTAGTFVSTPRGLVPIEYIRVGEPVLTHKGRYRKVLRIGSKIAVETVVLTGQGHPGLRTTKEHPFYACEKKQHYTRRQNIAVRDAWIEGPSWVDAETMAGKHWASIVDYPLHCIPQPELIGRESVICQVNEDLLWLAGAYLGDGWVRVSERRSYIMFGVNEKKSELIEARLKRLGLTATKIKVRTGIKLQVCSGALVRWIFNNFGKGCDGKRIPPWLLGASYELRRAAMDGYIATDGSKYQDGHRITTVCWELAVGTRMLANSLGHASGILGNVPSPKGLIEGRVINQRPTWTVNISNSNRTSFEQDGLRFGLVRKVAPAPAALVYNLEVEEDNTYCADGFVVHNCQGFSVAGLRGGLSDPRGQLTLSFVELANAIDDRRSSFGQQPCVVFWENVPGVRSDSGNAFGHFLAGLVGVEYPVEPGPRPEPGRSSAHWTWKKETGEHVAKWPSAGSIAGPRRTVAWRSSDAQYFGLAQRRERVFLVASAREGFDPQVVLLEFDGLRRDSAPSRDAGESVAGTTDEGAYRGSHWDNPANPHPSLNQSFNTGGIGQSNQEIFSQRGAYLVGDRPVGAAGVKWPAEIAATLNAHFGEKMGLEDQHINGGASLFVLAPSLQPVIPILEAGARTGNSTTDLRAGIGIGIDGDPMSTLQSSKQHAVAVMPFNTTQITSPENGSNPQWGDPCFSLAAGNHPPAVAISVALRGREGGGTAELGNDVTTDLAPTMRAMNHSGSHQNGGGQLAVCVTGDITHTLTSEGFDASEDGTGRGQPIIAFDDRRGRAGDLGSLGEIANTIHAAKGQSEQQCVASTDMAVRRLMPEECESLQGFPRNWTLVPVGKGMAADGPRYKQLGNSWAVPCVSWIGRRLDRHLAELDGMIIDVVPVQTDAMTIWMCAA